ncbi:MAG: potassium-transporting ATPase subunit F [Bacteriovoracaceae bacterium]
MLTTISLLSTIGVFLYLAYTLLRPEDF